MRCDGVEITGPLFMSYPVVSNLQYRLTDVDGGTLITLCHTALGFIPPDGKEGMTAGWTHLLARTRAQAETSRTGRTAAR